MKRRKKYGICRYLNAVKETVNGFCLNNQAKCRIEIVGCDSEISKLILITVYQYIYLRM